MKHLNKTAVRLTILAMLMLSVVSIGVTAQRIVMTETVGTVPIVLGELEILPGTVVEGLPSDFAPLPEACDNAAGSYMSAGVDAIRTTMVQFDSIVYDNKDPELVLYALYALEANEFGGVDVALNNPDDLDTVGDFTDGTVTVMGDESTCLTNGSMTVRLWELENGTWVVDTIAFSEPVDISEAWNISPNQQQPNNVQSNLPVLVDGLVLRYLMPYVEPPVTTLPGGNTDQIAPQPTMCDGTAPSNLYIGADVQFYGYGYSQFPTNDPHNNKEWETWVLSNTQIALGEYGSQVYDDIRKETPMTGIVGNFESATMSADDLYDGIKFGQVLDGPYCTSADVSEPYGDDILESTIGDDRFYMWWLVDVNGTVGWYPEVVGQYSFWLWENHGMFDRKLTMYFMTPFSTSQTVPDTCPPSILHGGLEVEPAIGTMNLRTEPNGDVMGRLDMAETVILSSGPVCEGGSNWWWTDRGFLAENDPETRTALLLPAVQQVREAVDTEDTTETVVTPVPSQPQPEPTREPESNNNDDNDRDNNNRDRDRDNNRGSDSSDSGTTVTITTATAGGSSSSSSGSSSSCDPATGAGC